MISRLVVYVLLNVLITTAYGQTAAEVWGRCVGSLTLERSNNNGADYVDITSSLSETQDGMSTSGELVQNGVLADVTENTKLMITCNNDQAGEGGLIFSILYDGQYFNTDGDDNGYYTLESAGSGLTNTLVPPSLCKLCNSRPTSDLQKSPYKAEWTWTCFGEGCLVGNTEVYTFIFPTLSPTPSPTTTTTKEPTTKSPTPLPTTAKPTAWNELRFVGNPATNLGFCEGDCDRDSDCIAGLVCYQRGQGEAVPGCVGTASGNTDYCVEPPPISSPTTSGPTKTPTNSPTKSPTASTNAPTEKPTALPTTPAPTTTTTTTSAPTSKAPTTKAPTTTTTTPAPTTTTTTTASPTTTTTMSQPTGSPQTTCTCTCDDGSSFPTTTTTTTTTVSRNTDSGRDPAHVCLSSEDYVESGSENGNYYSFAGQPCYCWGDPHCTPIFSGVEHNFQGRDGRQYVYMTRCHDSSVEAMPFQLLGKHWEYKTDAQHTIEYVTLKLFDGVNYDTPYLVHIHSESFFCYYRAADSGFLDLATRQLYDENVDICSPILPDTHTPIGESGRFSIYYSVDTEGKYKGVDVSLTVWQDCDLNFYFKRAKKKKDGRYRSHGLNIYPPECFRCHTCGLCGAFKGVDTSVMPTCDGGSVLVETGEKYGAFAYDENGNTYDAEYCCRDDPLCPNEAQSRRLLESGEVYTPTMGDFVPVDACDPQIEDAVIAACAAARATVEDCCLSLGDGGITCDRMVESCNVDACAFADGNAALIDEEVQQIFTDDVTALCAENEVRMAAQQASGQAPVALFDPLTLSVNEAAEAMIVATPAPTESDTSGQQSQSDRGSKQGILIPVVVAVAVVLVCAGGVLLFWWNRNRVKKEISFQETAGDGDEDDFIGVVDT